MCMIALIIVLFAAFHVHYHMFWDNLVRGDLMLLGKESIWQLARL